MRNRKLLRNGYTAHLHGVRGSWADLLPGPGWFRRRRRELLDWVRLCHRLDGGGGELHGLRLRHRSTLLRRRDRRWDADLRRQPRPELRQLQRHVRLRHDPLTVVKRATESSVARAVRESEGDERRRRSSQRPAAKMAANSWGATTSSCS